MGLSSAVNSPTRLQVVQAGRSFSPHSPGAAGLQTDDHSADQPLVVLTTVGHRRDAEPLVRSLVTQRLVACGSMIEGITSIFRWEGAVHEEGETLVLLKTTAARWEELREAIHAEHPYDVPEILALPVKAGHPSYLSWVRSATE